MVEKKRGRQRLTRELYEFLLASYREQPGNATAAARRAGCDRRMAGRVWGGPRYDDYPWATPIREVLEEEKRQAMAMAREAERQRFAEADAQRAAERAAIVEAKAQEEQALKLARADVISALAIAAELVPAMRAMAKVVVAAAQPDPVTGMAKVGLKDAMGLIRQHSSVVARAVQAADQVLALSRLDRGQPTSIVGLQPVAPTLTYEESLEELQEATELLAVVRARGLTLPGGAGGGAFVEGDVT